MILGAGAVALFAGQQVGCSSTPAGLTPEPGPDATAGDATGSVGLRLTLPGGETLGTVTWTITGPNGSPNVVQTNTINVQNSNTVSFIVGNLPAGANYTVTLSGTTVDGTVTCGGSAQFSIAARMTASVTVLLQCGAIAPDAGSVAINGQPYNCATANGVAALPSETTVGNSVGLTASATAADLTSLTYAWSAPSGTFSAPTSAATNFTCTAPGPVTVTVTAGDGPVPDGGTCNAATSTSTVVINCDVATGTTDAGTTDAGGTSACRLGPSGAIKHVIYVQFDNTHLMRDRASVPSDLEQMPHLLDFIRGNGTMMANDHTILISHTAGGFLSSFTGLYPDRHGQTVTNSYVRTSATGTFGFPSSFAYWTDPADTTTTLPNMVGPDGTTAPAPWVSYTRAGCDFGAVAGANIVLENTGTGASGDVTKVFGSGSPQFTEAQTSAAAASGTAARNKAQTDLVGFAVHCSQNSTFCAAGEPDLLPQEVGGYNGFKGLFGAAQIDPILTGQAATVPVTDIVGNPVVDPFNQPGFPGFDGMSAAASLGYVASMQEHGIPVTYAYISDAHDNHGVAGNAHTAYGPGAPGYEQQLAQYDAAFAAFFTRLQSDGIDKTNTLFVFTVDEGDHFVGGAPTPANCDGTTTTCDWTNQIGELNANIDTLVANQFPSVNANFLASGAPDTFTVHGDDAPPFYLAKRGAGALSQTDPATRDFERNVAHLTAVNPFTGNTDNLLDLMADQAGMKAIHMMTSGDPARNPTFAYFADADYFLTDFPTSTCLTCVNPAFAWNHGDVQPVIGQTWLGFVGPGVQNQADQTIFTDHTDVRPTINSILGLHDSYQDDGRVITEALTSTGYSSALAASLSSAQSLGAAYKAINAPFGPFANSILTVSTFALAANDANDATYTSLESQITSLTSQRDTLATTIRAALDATEFSGAALDATQAQSWVAQAQTLLNSAATLATGNTFDAGTPPAPDAGTPADAGGSSPADAGAPVDAAGGTTTTDIDIYRVGDGTAALANTGNAVFVDEFTPQGTLVKSTAMPTTLVGSNHRLVSSGTASSEGLISRSVDGKFVVLTGYDSAIPAASSVAASAAATTPRVVGRLDASGNVDTTTALTDYADANNPRSVASTNGIDFWVTGAAGGIRKASLGGTTSTQLSTTVVNLRQVDIFASQLYVTDSSGSAVRLGTVGSGLPTTAGQTITNLPGFATSTGSPYAFFFADLDPTTPGLDTLYVVDDAAGLTKYSLVSNAWVSNGTVGVATDTYRGLTGVVSGTTVTLYTTRKGGTAATGGGELATITDASGFNAALTGTPTLLATAIANTAFRGVALAPQP